MDVLKMLKDSSSILEGHFELTSGYHSQYYLQCAGLLQFPRMAGDLAASAIRIIGDEMDTGHIDTVVSPAVGGILWGYMLAYRLESRMIFTERTGEGKMSLRRGFKLSRGERVLVAEDVITTGGSVMEVIKICEDSGAKVLAVAGIVDRNSGVNFGYPYYYMIKLNIEKYEPNNCPLCKKNIKMIYPGSKNKKPY
ncbi:MAG: orotate phosphoribosyltransferase [Actinobacteria bacterium]|nr:orotate phosphoribosyltransferase [Actinomycetota bacterium]